MNNAEREQVIGAIESGSLKFIQKKLENDKSWLNKPLMQQNHQNDPALFWAMKHNKSGIVVCLLLNGADPNSVVTLPNGDKHSLLYLASHMMRNMELANQGRQFTQLLVNNGADINQILWGDYTLFHLMSDDSKLFQSVTKKLTDYDKSLLTQGNKLGATPLVLAVVKGNITVFDWLVENGVSPLEPDARGVYPLHMAACSENTMMVQRLLSFKPDVNCITQFDPSISFSHLGLGAPQSQSSRAHYSPLQIAVMFGSTGVMLALLAAGADVNQVESDRSPLSLAIMKKAYAKISLLLEKGAKVLADEKEKSDILLAIKTADIDTIKIFLQHIRKNNLGISHQELNKLTERLIRNKKQRIKVQVFISNFMADVLYEDNRLPSEKKLEVAIVQGNEAEVRKHACQVADINKETKERPGFNFIFLALGYKKYNINIIKTLLEYGANPDSVLKRSSMTLLSHVCDAFDDYELVRLLLEHGANPNHFPQGGFGLGLHFSVQKNNPAIIQLLLDYGADPNIFTRKPPEQFVGVGDESAWHIACLKGFPDALELLLKYPKIDLTTVPSIGVHPLWVLARSFVENDLHHLQKCLDNLALQASEDGIVIKFPQLSRPQRKLSDLANLSKSARIRCMKLLLEHGASLAVHAGRLSAATMLSMNRDLSVLKELSPIIDFSIFAGLGDDEIISPVVMICLNQNYTVLKYLFSENKINLDQLYNAFTSQTKMRLLDVAMVLKDENIVALLTRFGANVDLLSFVHFGKTYREVIEKNFPKARRYLDMQEAGDSEAYDATVDWNNASSDGIGAAAFIKNLTLLQEKTKTRPQGQAATNQFSNIFAVPTAAEPVASWFSAAISATDDRVSKIENSENGDYIYLDQAALLEQGCDPSVLQNFLDARKMFKDSRIRRLEGTVTEKEYSIHYQGEAVYQSQATHELKLRNTESRIILFPVREGHNTLYIGAVYLAKGLHTHHGENGLRSRSEVIELSSLEPSYIAAPQ